MRRLFALAAALAAGPALADYPPGPDKDGVVHIALSVSPAKAPVPASKFNVYPEYRDLQPGSRVQGLLRTFAEQNYFFHNKERAEQRDKWLKSELVDLPADVREQAGVSRGLLYDGPTAFLGIADRAARFKQIEWNEYFDLRKDGAFMLLPEVQQMRQLAAAVQLRMRGEIKAGEWPRAVESVKTLFGIAQALEQHPTLISNLVGIAIAQIALNGLEEMAGQPNCPSLYWALTALPERPVNTRYGMGGDRMFPTSQFDAVIAAKRAMSAAELAPYLKVVAELAKGLGEEEKKKFPEYAVAAERPAAWFGRIAAEPNRLTAAVMLLTERGQPADAVKAMSPAQIGLLDELYTFETLRDEQFKWYPLPHWQAIPGMQEAEKAITAQKGTYMLAPLFAPTLYRVKSAETRLAQRTALLRAVEAVRLHLGSKGELPATLAAAGVPEPFDPVTGKPFSYTVKDGVAILRGENPQVGSTFIVEYTIRARK